MEKRPHRGSPPLARGILFCLSAGRMDLRITPACAGNTSLILLFSSQSGDHPRLRGEYGSISSISRPYTGSPPLARGIQNLFGFLTATAGITPACAGNTEIVGNQKSKLWDHPRLRGEYYAPRPVPCASQGITPACAGNTVSLLHTSCFKRDHPRLRGEYLSLQPHTHLQAGSPPLARGIPGGRAYLVNVTGITPACAGNTLPCRYSNKVAWDHPRLRGEYI